MQYQELDLDDLLDQLRLLPRELGELAYISRSTAHAWRQAGRAPRVVVDYLQLYAHGIRQDGPWRDWSLSARDGALTSPAGQVWMPGDLLAMQYERMLMASAQARLRRLETKPEPLRLVLPEIPDQHA